MATSKFGKGRDDAARSYLSALQVWLIIILMALTLELAARFPVSTFGSEVCGRLVGTIWAWNTEKPGDPDAAPGRFGTISGPDHGVQPGTDPTRAMTRSFI